MSNPDIKPNVTFVLSQTWLYEDNLGQVLPGKRAMTHALHDPLDLLEQRGLSPAAEHRQSLLHGLEHFFQRARWITSLGASDSVADNLGRLFDLKVRT